MSAFMHSCSARAHPPSPSSGSPPRRSYPPSLACRVRGSMFAPQHPPLVEKARFRLPTLKPRGLQGGMRYGDACHIGPTIARRNCCRAMPLHIVGGPASAAVLMANRSLCHRTQSSRARIVTRFTIPGSCDRPPARCESAWLQRRGRSVDERLNCSHSILSTQGPDMRKACWAIPPHMRRNASRIQFHSRRKGHQRAIRKPLSTLLRDSLLVRLGWRFRSSR